MTLFGLFRRPGAPNSAQAAKERLQVLLAHERQDRVRPDYLPLLHKDILEAIRKYVHVASEKVEIRLRRGGQTSMIEIEIELPGPRSPSVVPKSAFAG